jgi:hypothetical protein
MHSCKVFSAFVFTIAMTASTAASAALSTGPFTGNLDADDNVVLLALDLEASGTYRFESFSYAGGTLSDGTVVARGGFDVVLSLFDADGALLVSNDDGGSLRFDPDTNKAFDAVIEIGLGAGAYTLAVTQYNNFPFGSLLSEGFTRDGLGNFTPDLLSEGECSATSFCDVSGVAPFNARTSFFAVDVTPVPLPPALLLFVPALATLAARGRHRGDATASRKSRHRQ